MTTKVVIHFSDDGTVSAEYESGDPLTTEELGNALAVLLGDTLGDDPQIADIVAIQGAMAGALK